MMEYDHGDVLRIQHFVKVYEFARMIGLMEGLDAKTQFTLESAAVVHDIGIHMPLLSRNMEAAAENIRSWKARRRRKNCWTDY